MAVTSRDIHNERRPIVQVSSVRLGSLAYVITGLLALLALYVILSTVFTWGQVKLDDIRYGRPRTFHLTANVGHGGANGALSHFVAMNLDRQVVILEIPGGDVNQIRSLPGPYLFGAGEDLTPVTMRLADANRDSAPDLLVRVKDEEMVYLNRDGSFVLITPEERQQLLQQQVGAP
jgi:hypothetical protein